MTLEDDSRWGLLDLEVSAFLRRSIGRSVRHIDLKRLRTCRWSPLVLYLGFFQQTDIQGVS